MEGQGDSCRVEPLGERARNSAVGFDMLLTLSSTARGNHDNYTNRLERVGWMMMLGSLFLASWFVLNLALDREHSSHENLGRIKNKA